MAGSENNKNNIFSELRSISPFRTKRMWSFRNKDFIWTNDQIQAISDNMYEDQDRLNEVPFLSITEFQPDYAINIGDVIDKNIDVIAGAGEQIIKGLASKLGNKKQVGFIFGVTKQLAKVGAAAGETVVKFNAESSMEDTTNQIENSLIFGGDEAKEKLIKTPVDLIQNMISGKFVSRFEIPFFGNDFFESDGSAGWSSTGLKDIVGEKIAGLIQKGMPMDVPGVPEWKNTNRTPESVRLKLQLINNTIEDAGKNFAFLNSLAAGSFWLQMGNMQKSPNLYWIECPGRFVLLFCSMNITVSHYGKSRKLIDSDLKSLFINSAKLSPDLISKPFFSHFFIPDAYEIDITFNSLMPNNFNIRTAYYLGEIGYLNDVAQNKTFKTTQRTENRTNAFARAAGQSGTVFKEAGKNIINWN